MSIFQSAYEYDFNTIQAYIKNGGNVNICNEQGYSLLTCFVKGYLVNGNPLSADEKKLCDAHPEEDDDFWDSYVFRTQLTPLADRNCGILSQLEFFFSHGADPNLCQMIDDMTETALMLAVCSRDYYLTKYLLENGADPGLWLFTPDDLDLNTGKEYWLMDEMDIAIMNGDKGDAAGIDLSIAHLLWQYGLTEWSGYCIDVDKEKGVIGGHSMRLMY